MITRQALHISWWVVYIVIGMQCLSCCLAPACHVHPTIQHKHKTLVTRWGRGGGATCCEFCKVHDKIGRGATCWADEVCSECMLPGVVLVKGVWKCVCGCLGYNGLCVWTTVCGSDRSCTLCLLLYMLLLSSTSIVQQQQYAYHPGMAAHTRLSGVISA